MLRHILTIAKNTFRETLRDRILLSAFVVVLLIIGFSLFVGTISVEQNVRMVVDFSLTSIYLLQMFVAIFIGSMLMYKEVERRTFFLIIPKPIKMESIILGKCLGLTATTALVTALSTSVLLIILTLQNQGQYFVPILISTAFSILESSILILLTILFSSFTSPILSAVYTIGFFLIGHSSEFIRFLLAETTSTIKQVVLTVTYYGLPNLEKFNLRNDVIYLSLPSFNILAVSLLYALFYLGLIFLLARLSLKNKEF